MSIHDHNHEENKLERLIISNVLIKKAFEFYLNALFICYIVTFILKRKFNKFNYNSIHYLIFRARHFLI